MFLFFLPDSLLRFFIDDIGNSDWQDTAQSWLIVAVVVAVLGTGLVLGYKAFRKYTAVIAKNKIWTRRESWLLIAVGVFPVFVFMLAIWYLSRDYVNYVQVGGLLRGTLAAWLLYLLLMVIGHLVSPWRREII